MSFLKWFFRWIRFSLGGYRVLAKSAKYRAFNIEFPALFGWLHRGRLTMYAADDATRTPTTEMTTTDDLIYSDSATGATPHRR